MGFTLLYLGLVVLFPLAVLAFRATGVGPAGAVRIATDPRTARLLAAVREGIGGR